MPLTLSKLRHWPTQAGRGAIFALGLAIGFIALPPALSAAFDVKRVQKLVAQKYGRGSAALFLDWRQLIGQTAVDGEMDKLRKANQFFNRHINFSEDDFVWGQTDYWATPVETIGRLAGDCEDFAIAKYFTLIEMGVAPSKLRLTYVRARIGGPTSSVTQAHMVLTFYDFPEAEPFVLDNLIEEIRTASQRPDLKPVFSFNADGMWAGGSAGPARPVDRLTRWKDLLLRMKLEGYQP